MITCPRTKLHTYYMLTALYSLVCSLNHSLSLSFAPSLTQSRVDSLTETHSTHSLSCTRLFATPSPTLNDIHGLPHLAFGWRLRRLNIRSTITITKEGLGQRYGLLLLGGST